MTNAEAIETLRANYPDACYEQLREAVDEAIRALKAQDADIQKMQDIEQSMLEKAYECGKRDVAQWIPCSERLPETGEDVVLCCAVKNIYGMVWRYICIGYHVGRYEMESDLDWDEGCDEYREEDDKFYVLEGWYERIHNWDDYGSVAIEGSILAWMPLPEPYCEEGDNT